MRTEACDVIVIGGGLSGLGVAGILGKAGKKVVLVEKGGVLGGRAQSIDMDGFTLDLGPHVIQEKGFQEEMTDLLGKGDELRELAGAAYRRRHQSRHLQERGLDQF